MSNGILIFGTGAFAARIACDIAAAARDPVAVTLAGRNRERLDWLVTAGNARAETFGGGARFSANRWPRATDRRLETAY